MGDSVRRNTVDASKDKGFWIDVQAASVTPWKSNARDESVLQDGQCLANTGFDPQNVEQHTQEKLGRRLMSALRKQINSPSSQEHTGLNCSSPVAARGKSVIFIKITSQSLV